MFCVYEGCLRLFMVSGDWLVSVFLCFESGCSCNIVFGLYCLYLVITFIVADCVDMIGM